MIEAVVKTLGSVTSWWKILREAASERTLFYDPNLESTAEHLALSHSNPTSYTQIDHESSIIKIKKRTIDKHVNSFSDFTVEAVLYTLERQDTFFFCFLRHFAK